MVGIIFAEHNIALLTQSVESITDLLLPDVIVRTSTMNHMALYCNKHLTFNTFYEQFHYKLYLYLF
jgi:hypothetical protein